MPLKIVLDTNNVNAYGKRTEINFIEKCENDGIIEIFYGGYTLFDLSNDKSHNPIRLQKFNSKNKVLSTLILGHSVLGLCVLGNDNSEDVVNALSWLIFEERWANLGRNSRIDIKLIEASVLSEVNFFVTEEKKLLEKSAEIESNYGLKIVNRESMKAFLLSFKIDSTLSKK